LQPEVALLSIVARSVVFGLESVGNLFELRVAVALAVGIPILARMSFAGM
jgi:hypothetical protein